MGNGQTESQKSYSKWNRELWTLMFLGGTSHTLQPTPHFGQTLHLHVNTLALLSHLKTPSPTQERPQFLPRLGRCCLYHHAFCPSLW